jgi:hypothetical protein
MLAQTDKHYVKMRTLHVTRERKVDQGWCVFVRGEQIRFGSVRFLPEKNSQTEKKKDPKRTGTGPNRPVSVRFFG